MSKKSVFFIGVIAGILSILTIPVVLAHNEDAIFVFIGNLLGNQNKALEKLVNTGENAIKELKDTREYLKNKVDTLQTSHDQLKSDHDALKRKHELLQQKLQTLEAALMYAHPLVSKPIPYEGGALPRKGSFVSAGGTLMLFVSVTAFSTDYWMKVAIKMDGKEIGMLQGYTNKKSHKVLNPDVIVLPGIPAGKHEVELNVTTGQTDVNDFSQVTVLELPKNSGWSAYKPIFYGHSYPREGYFVSKGNPSLIFTSCGAISSAKGIMKVEMKIDDVLLIALMACTNEPSSHKALNPNVYFLRTISPGERKIKLLAEKCDHGDFSQSTVLELPTAFCVYEPIPYAAGVYPRTGSFISKGGTLLVFASGTAFLGAIGIMQVDIKMDARVIGHLKAFTNEPWSHKALNPDVIVLDNIPAGSHAISLESAGTNSDITDFSQVTVLELPR